MSKTPFLTMTATLVAIATLLPSGKSTEGGELSTGKTQPNSLSAAVSILSRSQDRYTALTTCVEAPSTVVRGSRRRQATMTNCSPSFAKTDALGRAREKAAKALAPACRARITPAEARALCAARGMTPGFGSIRDFVSVAGGATIDGVGDVQSDSVPLCAVLRDVDEGFKSTKQGDLICILDGFKRTIFTADSRARCGVRCEE